MVSMQPKPNKREIAQANRLLRSMILFHWGPEAEEARQMNIGKIAKLIARLKDSAYEKGYTEGFGEGYDEGWHGNEEHNL